MILIVVVLILIIIIINQLVIQFTIIVRDITTS